MQQEKPSILIDLGKLTDLYSGLGQVSLHFGKALLKENKDRFRLTFLVPKGTEKYFDGDVRFEYLSLQKRYLPALNKKFDLWHALHQDSAYMPGAKNASYLLTIHDLNFLEEKPDAKAQSRLKKLQQKANRANAIATISDFTEQIVKENLKLHNLFCAARLQLQNARIYMPIAMLFCFLPNTKVSVYLFWKLCNLANRFSFQRIVLYPKLAGCTLFTGKISMENTWQIFSTRI